MFATFPAVGIAWQRRAERRFSLWALLFFLVALTLPQVPEPLIRPLPAEPQPIAPQAVAPVAATSPPSYALPPELVGKPELAALRTSHSATFDLGEGRFAVFSEVQPLHYQDAAGAWQPISPQFERVEGGWLNRANSVRTGVAEHMSAAKLTAGTNLGLSWQPEALLLVDGDGEHAVAMPRQDGSATAGRPSRDGTLVRYSGSWTLPGLEDQWDLRRGGSQYTMRLPALPQLPPASRPAYIDLAVRLELLPGTRIRLDGATASLPITTADMIEFVGPDGEVLELLAPLAFEQATPGAAVAASYLLRPTDKPQQVELRVRLPWAWLADQARAFPVIVDPIFQMRSSTRVRTAEYTQSGSFVRNFPYGDRVALGEKSRALVRFDMPKLPKGTQIDRAAFYAEPSEHYGVDLGTTFDNVLPALTSDVSVHAILTDTWVNSVSAEPLFDSALIAPGAQSLSSVSGADDRTGRAWDVTAQVRKWLPNIFGQNGDAFVNNPGLLLKAANEGCDPLLVGTIRRPNCGVFYFNTGRDSWADFDLEATQFNSSEDNLYTLPSPGSGLRLVVFYSGPQLVENTPIVFRSAAGDALPPTNTSPSPYYEADHLYTVPAMVSRWQALVARSFGPPSKANNCPPTIPGTSGVCAVPLKGGVPLDLRSTNDAFSLSSVPVQEGKVGYLLLNGTGSPDPITSQTMQLRISGVDHEEAKPLGYDVELVGQAGSRTLLIGVPQSFNYTFDSAEALALWNLNLPAGSNTRVKVSITGDGSFNGEYKNLYGKNFTAQIVRSDARLDLPDSTGKGADEHWSWTLDGTQPTSKMVLDAQPGRHALAIAYHGPELTTRDLIDCNSEICPTETFPIKYNLSVELLACGTGEYPTNGGCQKIECPNLSSFPTNNTTFREVGGLHLWSQSGWNGAETIRGSSAPLIGGKTTGNVTLATVAVLGGQIATNQATGNVSTSSDSTQLLIECQQNSATPLHVFPIYDGAMSRANKVIQPGDQLIPGLIAQPGQQGQLHADPWRGEDRTYLTAPDFYISPREGKAKGEADLRRRVDQPAAAVNLYYDVSWDWTARGWEQFTSSVTAKSGNKSPLDYSSMRLAPGGNLSMDLYPPTGAGEKKFWALRAPQATIAHVPQLGGASKPVQAVMLGIGIAIPEINYLCPSGESCVDLRGPTDSPTKTIPDRIWAMPDVHTNTAAALVMLQREGETLVYSADHPNATTQDFAQEYSFDAYKASVSVKREKCNTRPDAPANQPEVLVIKGEARIAMPNIGDSGDPNAAISSGFKICDGKLSNVHLEFQSPIGIPIGNSGMFLTGLSGNVDIFPDYTQIRLGLDFQAAPGGDGGIFKVSGEVLIDTRGLFEFQGSGKILGTVNAQGRIWVAWNPLDTGFEVSVSVGSWLTGFARAHLWEGQGWQNRYDWLPANDDLHFAGEIGATLTIEEGAVLEVWELTVPPTDISIGVELAFGEFCTNPSCTTYEWGIKGKFVIMGYDVGLYYGFEEGLDFIIGNDDHILIDQYGGANMAQLQAAGEPLNFRPAPATTAGTALQPLAVGVEIEQILVGLSWQAGMPQLTLIDPDGIEVTPQNQAAHQAEFNLKPTSTLVGLRNPKPGNWTAKLSGLSEAGVEHYKFVYFANKGAPGVAGASVQASSFSAPAGPNEPGTQSYTIRWQPPTEASISSTISLFYRRTEVITGNLEQGVPIMRNLPYSSGSYVWDTRGMLNGSYQVYAVVDDGRNELPINEIAIPDDTCMPLHGPYPRARAFDERRFPGTEVFTATGTVLINDQSAPPTPTGVQLQSDDSALMVRWNGPTERDTSSYLVRWGPAGGDSFFETGRTLVTAELTPTLRIGGLTNGLPYGVVVQALDANGQQSLPSTPQFKTPSGVSLPVPFAPISLTLSTRTSTSASFSWTPQGAQAASFRLTYTRADSGETGQTSVQGSSGTINGLATGMTYDVRVAGGSADGWFSAESTAVRVVVSNGLDGNGDGLPDDWASVHNVSGAHNDPDHDLLTNAQEYAAGTDPLVQDDDNDTLTDGEELQAKTDPLKSSSFTGAFSQPRLGLVDTTLTFRIRPDVIGAASLAAAAQESVAFTNAGGGTLQLQATSDYPWIKASVVNNTVRVSIDATGLVPGFYSGVVKLNQVGGKPLVGKPQCVRVKTFVYPRNDQVPAPEGRIGWLPIVLR